MKLLLKQRFFSWFDSYDVYYEDGSVAFKVKDVYKRQWKDRKKFLLTPTENL